MVCRGGPWKTWLTVALVAACGPVDVEQSPPSAQGKADDSPAQPVDCTPGMPAETDIPWVELPQRTGYADSCLDKLEAIFQQPVERVLLTTARIENRCRLGALEAEALGYYYAYWEAYLGWTEYLTPEHDLYAFKTLVFVDPQTGTAVGRRVDVTIAGADEATLLFVFDQDGELLLLHHNEQVPQTMWFCADAGQRVGDRPDEACLRDYLYDMPQKVDGTRELTGTHTLGEEPHNLTPLALRGLTEYADECGLPTGETVSFTYRWWTSFSRDLDMGRYDNGAIRASYSAAGQPTIGYVAGHPVASQGGDSDFRLYLRQDPSAAPQLTCQWWAR